MCDANFLRLKIKSEAYFLQHSTKDSKPNLIRTVLDGESSEILAYFPHLKKELEYTSTILNQIKIEFVDLCQEMYNLIVKSRASSNIDCEERLLKKNVYLNFSGDERFKRLKQISLEWLRKVILSKDVNLSECEKFLNEWYRKESDHRLESMLAAYYVESAIH